MMQCVYVTRPSQSVSILGVAKEWIVQSVGWSMSQRSGTSRRVRVVSVLRRAELVMSWSTVLASILNMVTAQNAHTDSSHGRRDLNSQPHPTLLLLLLRRRVNINININMVMHPALPPATCTP